MITTMMLMMMNPTSNKFRRSIITIFVAIATASHLFANHILERLQIAVGHYKK